MHNEQMLDADVQLTTELADCGLLSGPEVLVPDVRSCVPASRMQIGPQQLYYQCSQECNQGTTGMTPLRPIDLHQTHCTDLMAASSFAWTGHCGIHASIMHHALPSELN